MSRTYKIRIIKKWISPSEFYFQFLDGEFKKIQEQAKDKVTDVERKIAEFVKLKQHDNKEEIHVIGEIVTCYMTNWGRWVRAKITGYSRKHTYSLFLIDYGFKMHFDMVIDIPDSLKEDYHAVHKGSLGIESQNGKWSKMAIDFCKALGSSEFTDFHFIFSCKPDDVFIGDIFIFTPSGNFSLTTRLKQLEESVKSETNFDVIFETMRNSSYPKPVLPHQKIEIDVNKKELSLGNISQILFRENNFEPPKNLIVHGENLKARWKDNNESLLDFKIKKIFKNIEINDIQSFMWPQMFSFYRHAIIVSLESNVYHYLPPFLNNLIQMPYQRRTMGPTAIIFAYNSNKVKEIHKIVSIFSNALKIVEAIGLCHDKKAELINGCDILITTPPAFTRLTANISQQLMNLVHLKSVVFDGFDLISNFEKDLPRITNLIFSNPDNVPQILVTSLKLTKSVMKFSSKLPKEQMTICFDNFFEAACYAGLTFGIQVFDSFEKKIEVLSDTLESLKGSVIIANQHEIELIKKSLNCDGIKFVTDETEVVENATNLIHFSQPESFEIFTNRFSMMTAKIYEKMQGNKDLKLSTKIFFDGQNLDQFEDFLNFMEDRKLLNGENLEMLEKIKLMRENEKVKNNVNLCEKLLKNGECNNNRCSFRHILCDRDKLNLLTGNIRFTIKSILNPTEFIINVDEYCEKGEWVKKELTQKLQIFNLVPLDGQDGYENNLRDELEKKFLKLARNLIFFCKVQMSCNGILFTESFEAKNSKNFVKYSLKESLISDGISEVDTRIGDKLRKLIGFVEKTPLNKTKSSPKSKLKVFEGKKLTIEHWKEIKRGTNISFKLAHYESPYSFFVLVDTPENLFLKDWFKKIESFSPLKKLEDFVVGNCCLVLENEINKRGKIISINEDICEILLVDFGEIIEAKNSEVFELPEELRALNFQAIHCSIHGIKPKFNMEFWPSMQKTIIKKDLMKSCDWKMKIVGENSKSHKFSEFGVNSYEVILYHEEKFFHDLVIEKFYASPSDDNLENVEIFEDSHSDKQESSGTIDSGFESRESDTEPSFNYEGLQKLFHAYQYSVYSEKADEKELVETSLNRSNSTTIIPNIHPISSLVNMYTHPYIEWRQNEVYLYILVKALDCKDYGVKIDEFSFDIAIEYVDKKIERAILKLYGLIEPRMCSHDLKGGNVILRLTKRKYREWPRLTLDKTASIYIKFSDEKVPFMPTEQVINYSHIPVGVDDDDEEDDECGQFQYSSDEEFM